MTSGVQQYDYQLDHDVLLPHPYASKLLVGYVSIVLFFFSSRRRHTRCSRDWSSDVCSSDLLWNASFFCGSCAVLRRKALNEIGGVAVETVTEDAHTALRMQRRGWDTAYINIPQAAGLATESLAAHIGQRIRWARGMVQILRMENPLFVRGLSFPQRLCYFNATTHFLFALPRLIFLVIPLVYLLFGMVNIYGYSLAVFAYALPHIVLSNMTNSRIQGRHRFSFWNEIYEAVLAPYILFPTLLALVNS